MKRDLRLFIDDIQNSIKNIEDFSNELNKEKFTKDILRQSAIIRQLEIIGEAAKNLPTQFKNNYTSIPWKEISGFRDVLSHAYFGVSIERVWNIIEIDLPRLKKELDKIKLD